MEFRNKLLLIFVGLLSLQVYAQEPSSSHLNTFQETVWITSSKHLFLPGESVEIQMSLLEKDSYKKSSLSSFIRVELHDSKGNAVNQSNLALINSETKHTIHLPPDAKTGWYYIRAYTNWMRNFSENEFSVLAIKIVNPLDENLASMIISQDSYMSNLYIVDGHAGLFIGYDQFNGIETSGSLISATGDTLSNFITHKSGWTSFPLPVGSNKKYTIALNDSNNQEIIVEAIDLGDQEIKIVEDDKFLYISYPNDPEGKKLLIHQAYSLLWSEECKSQKKEWRISKAALPAGIIQLRVIRDDKETISYSLWSKSTIANIRTNPIEANSFGFRQNVDFNVSLPIENTELSVLITRDEPNEQLSKYIPGLPGWKSTSSIPNNDKAFNGWLIGQIFKSDQENFTEEKQVQYMPEIDAGIIEGQIVNKSSKQAVIDAGISINILNDNSFEETKTDSSGHFYFYLKDQEGSTDYLLNQTIETSPDNQIEAFSRYSNMQIELREEFSLRKEELDYLKEQNVLVQLKRAFETNESLATNPTDSVNQKGTFFHPPDFTIIVDNYIKLANVREIIYEVVPNVVVRQRNGQDYLKVFNDQSFAGVYETLVLLDGIPLKNQESVLKLSPDRIEKIEVKNRIYIHGRSIYSAIVNFISPNRDYAGLDLPEESVLSSIKLPANKAITTGLESKSHPSSLASLSENLKWSNLHLINKGSTSFMTNDLNGKFKLYIYGYDSDGNWIFTEDSFRVKN